MENTVEEKKIEDVSIIPIIVNTVDDPNNLSVSSISPLPEKADEVVKTEEEERETPVIPKTEKKEEIKKTSEEILPEKKVETKPPKVKDAVQERIDEITKKFRTKEREYDYEHTRRLELEAELKTAKSAIPQADKPKVENFETEADYLEALTDWKVEQGFRTEREKVSKEVATVDEKKAIDETYQELDEICEKGRTKYADFNELVLTDDFKFSDAELAAILLSDTAEDVLYYLGKHPEEAAEIAKLPPLKVAHEFGKIEARLHAPPPRKRTTNAPEPITPVKTTGVTEKALEDMNPREYRAARESGRK